MKSLGTGIALAASIILSGCGAMEYKPLEYNESHSRAYNIARAGGLVTGISDATARRDKTGNLTSNAAFGSAYTAAGFGAGVTGINGLAGGAINFLNWVSTPDSEGERNSIIAWMPADQAATPDEAKAKMVSSVTGAIEQGLGALGAKSEFILREDDWLIFNVLNDEWGCNAVWVNGRSKSADRCLIAFRIRSPWDSGTAPSFIYGASGSVYAFTSGGSSGYSTIRISREGENRQMPQDRIYTEISKSLPSWAYIYLAPKKVELASGENVPYLVLLENGHPEFFVYPES